MEKDTVEIPEIVKSKRGGARDGCGRKKTGRLKIYQNLTISGVPEDIELIKEKAKQHNKSIASYVIGLVKESE